jgi:N6-adenosine-specific RNA methylase IME4
MSAEARPTDLAALLGQRFGTILADPPWQFLNRTGKVAPEHRRLSRYGTMDLAAICALPVAPLAADTAHLYLWVPNALLPEGLAVMRAWGFAYKSTRGRAARTLPPGRRQVNFLATRKREHSRKPDEMYDVIEACSPAPRLELFARHPRAGWTSWGDQVGDP